MVCGIIVITALLVYCICNKMHSKSGGCGACASAKAAQNVGETGVAHAKDAAHLEELMSEERVVVMFHAPWCGHCQTMKPSFVEAAHEDTSTLYVMCDCENAIDMDTAQSKYGVEAFPTTRMYSKGKMMHEHDGARDKESIKSWVAAHK